MASATACVNLSGHAATLRRLTLTPTCVVTTGVMMTSVDRGGAIEDCVFKSETTGQYFTTAVYYSGIWYSSFTNNYLQNGPIQTTAGSCNGTGLALDNSTNNKFVGNYFLQFSLAIHWAITSGQTDLCQGDVFSNSSIVNCSAGVKIEAGSATLPIFSSCIIDIGAVPSPGPCIDCACDSLVVQDCYFCSNGVPALSLHDSNRHSVSGSTFITGTVAGDGIHLSNTGYGSIIGNDFLGNPNGIVATESNAYRITDNIFTDCATSAANLAGLTNSVYNNTETGCGADTLSGSVYGLDCSSQPTGTAVLLGNNGAVSARNIANTANFNVFSAWENNVFLAQSMGSAGFVGIGATILTQVDNAFNLGGPANRWAAVYSVNGTIQTSDPALKTDIAPLPSALPIVKDLNPITFRWKIGGLDPDTHEPRPGKRTHWGFLAPDVKAAFDKTGLDFGGYVKAEDGTQMLRPDQLIPVLWKAVQELSTKVAALEASAKAA